MARGLVLAALLSAATSAPALGDQSERDRARARARSLFKQGNALRARGQLEPAVRKYRAARALFSSYKIDLNLATTLYDLGRHAEAAPHFERFFVRGARRSPRPIVEAARAALAEIRRSSARLRIRCPVPGAMVSVNGVDRGTAPLRRAMYLAPGPHRIVVTAPGHRPHERTLTLTAGQRRRLQLTLRPTATSRRAAREPRLRRVWRRRTIIGWSSVGASLALAAAATVLYAVGGTQGTRAQRDYDALGAGDPDSAFANARDRIRAARAELVAGHVLAGTAAAAAAVGAGYLLTRPAREARVKVGLTAGREGVSLGLGATF